MAEIIVSEFQKFGALDISEGDEGVITPPGKRYVYVCYDNVASAEALMSFILGTTSANNRTKGWLVELGALKVHIEYAEEAQRRSTLVCVYIM